MLEDDQLNDLDEALLDILAEGRATPTLAAKMLEERGVADVSRQYVNQRLTRLYEHGHVENVLDTGVYELRSDPRERSDGNDTN